MASGSFAKWSKWPDRFDHLARTEEISNYIHQNEHFKSLILVYSPSYSLRPAPTLNHPAERQPRRCQEASHYFDNKQIKLVNIYKHINRTDVYR